jgi:hypothetical protein
MKKTFNQKGTQSVGQGSKKKRKRKAARNRFQTKKLIVGF